MPSISRPEPGPPASLTRRGRVGVRGAKFDRRVLLEARLQLVNDLTAGRGSVKKWIERYGDPRDPKVDAVDWVEQIPFSGTRNYVQRIMENLQVYRTRFGGGTRLQIEADLRRGAGVE